MAQAKKKTETPAKKAVKASSGVKPRTREEARPFTSKPGTPPLNDVHVLVRKDDQVQVVTIAGISEEEKVQQGYLQPLAKKYKFKKNKYERSKWQEVHSNAKGPTGGLPRRSKEVKTTLIAHFTNNNKVENFRSTISFKDVRFSEIATVLRATLNLTWDSNPYTFVSKFYHGAKTYTVQDGKASQV